MKEITIKQSETEDDELFRVLQRESLKRLQELSGDLWTDYNEHDPGVTMTDLLNYALTEFDYRLGFDVPDYLADDRSFNPERYGLFLPREVFPTGAVTLTDYRKLIIDSIKEVENVWVYPADEGGPGWYEVLVELYTGVRLRRQEYIRQEVERVFNTHRNLCEGLQGVRFVERKPLVMHGDVEMEADTDAAALLAAIYWEASQFFVEGARYRRVEDLLAEGETLDVLFDSPESNYWAIDDRTLKPLPQVYAIPVLYSRLQSLKGVKNVRSLSFEEDGQVYTDVIRTERADCSYTVLVPSHGKETGVRLLAGNTSVVLDFSHLQEMLYAYNVRYYGLQNRTADVSPFMVCPAGKRRDMYSHYSVQNDFPECYGINRLGVATGASVRRKAQARQLKAFLLLFDELLGRGLKELEVAPELLDIFSGLPKEGIVRLSAPEVKWDELVVEEMVGRDSDARCRRERERWADMLDFIYGESSHPAWLNAFDFYGDGGVERLERRLRFLRRVPEWGRNRSRGVDLKGGFVGNESGIKAYVSTLLGFETESGERPVVNVFPFYNLKLLDDERFRRFQAHTLSHDLLADEVVGEENMEVVPLTEKELTDADIRMLRVRLPLLHYNLLFESLFRDGIRLESYRLLNLPLQPDRLLVFYHRGWKKWVNLGRFDSRGELVETANALRRFLLMLNRKSETLYVVEHPYVFNRTDVAVTVVFPGWSARLSDVRFREACEELVCSRLPAHLGVDFRWFSPAKMWRFERAYYDWRKEFAAGEVEESTIERLKNTLL